MRPVKPSILCVEDNADNLELLKYLFESENFEVTACDNLEDSLEEAKKKRFSAIILEYYMGNRNSLEVCDEIRAYSLNTPIVFYSGEAREAEIKKALEHCAYAFLVKLLDFSRLVETINALIRVRPI